MVKYLVFCVFVAASYIVYSTFPVDRGPGIMVKNAPDIERLTWQEPFTFKGATVTPKKVIEGEVLIIKRKRYFFDRVKKYAPADAMVGWNQLSDERNLDYIFYSLKNRSYKLDLTRPPLSLNIIYGESDLWHLLPSTSSIDEKLKTLRDGHIIYVKGLIVDVETEGEVVLTSKTELTSTKNSDGMAIWIEELRIR
ncbi:MAG: hypothetical protein U5K71_06705 [Gracilimonas sp.]|nr:hypothetical protein [Gracilimonas sp.]